MRLQTRTNRQKVVAVVKPCWERLGVLDWLKTEGSYEIKESQRKMSLLNKNRVLKKII